MYICPVAGIVVKYAHTAQTQPELDSELLIALTEPRLLKACIVMLQCMCDFDCTLHRKTVHFFTIIFYYFIFCHFYFQIVLQKPQQIEFQSFIKQTADGPVLCFEYFDCFHPKNALRWFGGIWLKKKYFTKCGWELLTERTHTRISGWLVAQTYATFVTLLSCQWFFFFLLHFILRFSLQVAQKRDN